MRHRANGVQVSVFDSNKCYLSEVSRAPHRVAHFLFFRLFFLLDVFYPSNCFEPVFQDLE